MKPFTHFYKEILMVEASGGCCESVLMVWNPQEVAVKPFAYFYAETFAGLKASGRCCESMLDGLESPAGRCETICVLLQ